SDFLVLIYMIKLTRKSLSFQLVSKFLKNNKIIGFRLSSLLNQLFLLGRMQYAPTIYLTMMMTTSFWWR
ncbi:hypothetical protein, partial [Lonepinella sp. BR2271]|uniref:hypothetical protein n=1 Tax=Lonepinella sp. BR2271 TaxID=3434550 RepID=UPI003F6DE867